MKAIKIDVVKREVYYVDIETKNGSIIPDIYNHLECRTLDIVNLGGNIDLMVDDEGLLVNDPLGAFRFRGSGYIFSGHGIIVGHDAEGNTTQLSCEINFIKSKIIFCDISDLPEPFFQIITE